MSAVAQPELLERDAETGLLAALITASAQEGRLVVIEGPVGIGKTRLLAEVKSRAGTAGLEVLSAGGSELEREFPCGVVRQLFEPLLARAADDERAGLLGGAAGLVAPLFDPTHPVLDPDADSSFSILHGLFWLTVNAAGRRPVLLAIDDIHWCDPSSLRWLAYLLPRIETLPVLLVVGVRPAEPGADLVLLAHITGDARAIVLRPAPLSEEAAGQVVGGVLGQDVDADFGAACHRETGGNPLLLRELARGIATEGVSPTAANVPNLRELGAHAVSRAVLLRLSRLGEKASALARAVAVLGDDVDLRLAAAVANLDERAASEAAAAVARADILRSQARLAFVHPVVRAAVYADLSAAERDRTHARAARLLAAAGAEPERVAAHLLLVATAHDSWAVTVLREAARVALARAAPGSAVAYLRRALEEPPRGEERLDVLLHLGSAETLVSGPAAAGHLEEALALIGDPRRKAATAVILGRSLFFTAQAEAAVRVYTRAIDELAGSHADLRRQLEAGLVNATIMEPSLQPVLRERLAGVRQAPAEDDLGGKMLLALLAYHDARAGGPREKAIARARAALAGDALLTKENGGGPFVLASLVLAVADLDEALVIVDASVARAHRQGSVFEYAGGKVFRGRTFFFRGALADAEVDLRGALDACESWGITFGPLWAAAYLADALMEQGKLAAAAQTLDRVGQVWDVPDNAHAHWFLDSRARLRLLQGQVRQGVQDMFDLGRRFEAVGGRNPGFIGWRSQAALALFELGERDAAKEVLAEELESARRWGAPRALGRALRAAGLVEGGAGGLALLGEAVDVLEGSPARLEQAKALTELGAALRRANRRSEAREPLRRGLELATICGARPLVERSETELLATGARPRRIALRGVASLTPSERRVAEMAAEGRTNREIAQAVFVTPKTVEVHLSSAYRKLGIASRAQLPAMLAKAGTAAGGHVPRR